MKKIKKGRMFINSCVCILTDFSTKDPYIAQMKAVMLTISSDIRFIDLTHEVSPQNILQASFILSSSYKYFPPGTLFVCVVDPGVGTERKVILAEADGYFFLAPDNGLLYEILIQHAQRIIEVTNKKYFLKNISQTFHGRDIFSPVAAYFLKERRMEKFGKFVNIEKITPLRLPQVHIARKELRGQILHIDHFGNLVTNIPLELFFNFTRDRKVNGELNGRKIRGYATNYRFSSTKIPFFIAGSFGRIEVSLNRGSAEQYFKARIGDVLKVTAG